MTTMIKIISKIPMIMNGNDNDNDNDNKLI